MEEAILLDRHVLKLLLAHNLEWHVYLYDISSALATQFTQLRQSEDLEEAISLHRNALELLPASHPQQFTYLKGLADVLHTLEPRTGLWVWFRKVHIQTLVQDQTMATLALTNLSKLAAAMCWCTN